MTLGTTLLSPEESLALKLAAESTPILKTAPKVNGTTPTAGPPLAPNGNGDITPMFIPVDFEPFVTCVPGWTGPKCQTRISDLPTGLPTGVEPAPPGAIVPSEAERAGGGAPTTYTIQNGVPVKTVAAGVEKGFLIAPIAIAVAATIGLIVLLRDQ